MEVAACPLRTCGRSGRSNWASLANCSKAKASQPPPSPEHFDARRPTPNPETSKGCQRHPFATPALWRCRVALYSRTRTSLGRTVLQAYPVRLTARLRLTSPCQATSIAAPRARRPCADLLQQGPRERRRCPSPTSQRSPITLRTRRGWHGNYQNAWLDRAAIPPQPKGGLLQCNVEGERRTKPREHERPRFAPAPDAPSPPAFGRGALVPSPANRNEPSLRAGLVTRIAAARTMVVLAMPGRQPLASRLVSTPSE